MPAILTSVTARASTIFAIMLAFGLTAAAAGVRVVDGDTLEVDGEKIRLYGIDAPEAGQLCAKPGGGTWACGKAAIAFVERLVAIGGVRCDDRGLDDFGRTLAVCTAGGAELNRALVDAGLAWSFRRYAHDYDDAEDHAHAGGVGIWRADTEPAWQYRAYRWDVAAHEAPEGCPIKGNINGEGERIYHAPWSPWYGRTKVNTAAGERWFCDEGEALAAGWRAPRWGR
jgi:endonuclease YncB( thermonuclease family)